MIIKVLFMARKFQKLPTAAKTHLEAMTANGLLSESAARTVLGMPLGLLGVSDKQTDRVQVVFNLPAALNPVYPRALQVGIERLIDGR